MLLTAEPAAVTLELIPAGAPPIPVPLSDNRGGNGGHRLGVCRGADDEGRDELSLGRPAGGG